MQAAHKPAPARDNRFDINTHFAFGKNWAEFAQKIHVPEIDRACSGLSAILPAPAWAEKTVLDIGCGSGLHALGMLQLGAAEVCAVDFDPHAVTTTQTLLQTHAPDGPWQAHQANILDEATLQALPHTTYDIVYSWGVLHHTGDMHTAINRAAAFVKPGGYLLIALYKKTPLCGFWRIEKYLYTHAPRWAQRIADTLYAGLYCLGLLATGKNPRRYIRHYRQRRGMDFMTDIRDWLGGYPYDSIAPETVRQNLEGQGFTLLNALNICATRGFGVFGTGCAEYCFQKVSP